MFYFFVGISRSLYEAIFGYRARVRIASIGIPIENISNLSTGADVNAIIQQSEEKSFKNDFSTKNFNCDETQLDTIHIKYLILLL